MRSLLYLKRPYGWWKKTGGDLGAIKARLSVFIGYWSPKVNIKGMWLSWISLFGLKLNFCSDTKLSCFAPSPGLICVKRVQSEPLVSSDVSTDGDSTVTYSMHLNHQNIYEYLVFNLFGKTNVVDNRLPIKLTKDK